MQSHSQVNKRTGRYFPVKTRFRAPRIGPIMQIWEFSMLLKTMVRPLNQSNVNIKRWLGVKRTQKRNRFLGALNALGVTAREVTRFRAPHIGPRMQIWEFSKLWKTMIPPLHQSNVHIKR